MTRGVLQIELRENSDSLDQVRRSLHHTNHILGLAPPHQLHVVDRKGGEEARQIQVLSLHRIPHISAAHAVIAKQVSSLPLLVVLHVKFCHLPLVLCTASCTRSCVPGSWVVFADCGTQPVHGAEAELEYDRHREDEGQHAEKVDVDGVLGRLLVHIHGQVQVPVRVARLCLVGKPLDNADGLLCVNDGASIPACRRFPVKEAGRQALHDAGIDEAHQAQRGRWRENVHGWGVPQQECQAEKLLRVPADALGSLFANSQDEKEWKEGEDVEKLREKSRERRRRGGERGGRREDEEEGRGGNGENSHMRCQSSSREEWPPSFSTS
jgi:hypothetical protein